MTSAGIPAFLLVQANCPRQLKLETETKPKTTKTTPKSYWTIFSLLSFLKEPSPPLLSRELMIFTGSIKMKHLQILPEKSTSARSPASAFLETLLSLTCPHQIACDSRSHRKFLYNPQHSSLPTNGLSLCNCSGLT